jgi:hypothetical protein
MLEPMYLVDEGTTSRATATDVFNTFTEELDSLYLLSLLLTADHDKAEQCFVCAMGGCVEGIGVFMDWARSRARRAVLKYAIQMINPIPEHGATESLIRPGGSTILGTNNAFSDILALCEFERFVFVMSVLEGQSDQECATLLGYSRKDVMMARVLALKRLANTDSLYAQADEGVQA